jgi:hypothetical protein
MKVSDLRGGLMHLAACIELWGAKGSAGDLIKLHDALQKYDEMSIIELSKHLSDKPVEGKTTRSKVNEDLVKQILADLSGKDDFEEFSSALDVLSVDRKRVSNTDLLEIANRFVGTKVKGRSRDAAIKAIREARVIAARATNKVPRISGVF